MELLLILLKNGRHNPEDAVGAALAALAFTLIVGLISRIKSKKKTGRHLWLILSKETAKLNYTERPAVVWNEIKKCYCCPVCGQPIYKEY